MFDDESTAPRQHRLPGRVPRREGGHSHPPRRPPAAPAPERPAPQGLRPAGAPSPRSRQLWATTRASPAPRTSSSLCRGSPLLRRDRIRGDRRPRPPLAGTRPGRIVDPGALRFRGRGRRRRCVCSRDPAVGDPACGRPNQHRRQRPRPRPDGLTLGTYRDLWASEVTVRNPALRFLMPEQRLELSAKDAKSLELGNGDPGHRQRQRLERRGSRRDPRADAARVRRS